MSIIEIILSGVLLLASILTCVVTLSMDKADSNISVINGLTPAMQKNNKGNIKYTKNKIVIACMIIIIGLTVLLMVLNVKGVI